MTNKKFHRNSNFGLTPETAKIDNFGVELCLFIFSVAIFLFIIVNTKKIMCFMALA